MYLNEMNAKRPHNIARSLWELTLAYWDLYVTIMEEPISEALISPRQRDQERIEVKNDLASEY